MQKRAARLKALKHQTTRGPPRAEARLAQLAERKALNLVVVGSSPTVGVFIYEMIYVYFSLY